MLSSALLLQVRELILDENGVVMRLFILISLYISLFVVSSCGKIILMKGPDGDIRECKGEYGFGGQIGAEIKANACAEEYEKVGYKRVT